MFVFEGVGVDTPLKWNVDTQNDAIAERTYMFQSKYDFWVSMLNFGVCIYLRLFFNFIHV